MKLGPSPLSARRMAAALLLGVLLLTGCTGARPTEPSSSASSYPEPTATPTEARIAIADDDRELVLFCEGEGSPTVVLEDGHPSETGGVFRFTTGQMWAELRAETRVCAYDRAGYGRSDPAPMEPRDADDVTDDLHALLTAADEAGPYVMVGSSFGGMIVTYYASRNPEDVAAVVLLDVPAPTDALTLQDIPELA